MFKFFMFILCLIGFPIGVLIGLAIWVSSGLPILFRQTRIGKNGKPFTLYKFRSMRVRAEHEQKKLQKYNESDGPVFKIANDPRFTFLGKYLARTGVDEIPQLYNVLRGDMALFGPRPLPVAEAAKLKPWQKKRHIIKPGILSPAILTGKYHEDFDAWMGSDVAYVKEKSVLYDVRLAAKAVKFLFGLIRQEIVKNGEKQYTR